MGSLLLAGAISGLGGGLEKSNEMKHEKEIEAGRTARDMALQRMREKGAMDRTQEQNTATAKREEARYGPGGFEEQAAVAAGTREAVVAETAQGYEIAQIEATGAETRKTATDKQAWKTTKLSIETMTPEGGLEKKEVPVSFDPKTKTWYRQVGGKPVPLDMESALPPVEAKLLKNPNAWEEYKNRFGKLPTWYTDIYGEPSSGGDVPVADTGAQVPTGGALTQGAGMDVPKPISASGGLAS